MVFIEDYHDRTIHQAAVTNIKSQRPSGGGQVTGIANQAANTNLRLYPNPASHQLQVRWEHFPYGAKDVNWQITTITGKVVKQGKWHGLPTPEAIDLRALAEGVYWLKVVAGNQVFYRKFEKH